jgi:hypothetical protein
VKRSDERRKEAKEMKKSDGRRKGVMRDKKK